VHAAAINGTIEAIRLDLSHQGNDSIILPIRLSCLTSFKQCSAPGDGNHPAHRQQQQQVNRPRSDKTALKCRSTTGWPMDMTTGIR
jgi:hypothetical protein